LERHPQRTVALGIDAYAYNTTGYRSFKFFLCRKKSRVGATKTHGNAKPL
jgi:hypothetical protein